MFSIIALIPLLAALASATVTPLQVAGLKANFENAKLTAFVPNSDSPSGILEGGFLKDIGAPVEQDAANARPDLSVNALASFNGTGPYTVLLVDANIVGTNATGASQNLHWLTNGVTLGSANDGAYPLAYDSANDIRAYAGPGPAPSSGAHRYMFLFYEQAADFAAPEGYNAKIESVDAFDLQSYVTSAKLGNLVAANYMTVENGQASMTVEKTMPVDSSTLSAAEATGSSAGNSTASATETGSASAGAGATSGASRSGSPSNTGSAGNSSNTSVPPATNTNGAAGMTLPAMGLAMVAAVAAALV